MGKIFLTSDFHFGHNKEFIYKPRGFNSIDEMNSAIFDRYQETITDEDTVIIAGDLMLGDNKAGMDALRQMNGQKIIVLGNHDTDNRYALYKTLPKILRIEEVGYRLKYDGYHFVVTHYPMLTGNLERESLRQMTCNFYGHTHQKTNFYEERPYMYHVGVDSHNCYPVSIDEAIADMTAKVRDCIDYL